MGMKTWTVLHYEWRCDRCDDARGGAQGDPKATFDPAEWRKVLIASIPGASDPLGSERDYLLCPGCSGMLEHFLGLGAI